MIAWTNTPAVRAISCLGSHYDKPLYRLAMQGLHDCAPGMGTDLEVEVLP